MSWNSEARGRAKLGERQGERQGFVEGLNIEGG